MIGPSNASNLSQFFKTCPVLNEFGYCSCEIIIANPTALREMGKATINFRIQKTGWQCKNTNNPKWERHF